jgi:ribosomal protein S18 acetylase RimI-like enzyme
MTMPLIRQADLADLPSIAPLFDAYRQFYEQPPDLYQATQFISERMENRQSVILVAETMDTQNQTITGPLLGFCQLYPGFCSVLAKPIYTLYDLYVAPQARRTGTGRALLLAAHEHALNHGFARMDLTTARNNHNAQALYESLGWVRDEVFLGYSRTV